MESIWIDTDIALGAPRGDVDDGFAVAAVLAAEGLAAEGLAAKVKLAGISIVGGNTDPQTAAKAARQLLAVFGRGSIPVVAQDQAPARLAALDEGTSILALGPLTNLVRAAELDEGFPRRVNVRAVGSVLNRRRHPLLPFFCLNFRHDPAAGRIFMTLPWQHRRLFPLDVVARLRVGSAELDRLAALGGPAAYLAEGSRRWLRQAPLRYFQRRFPVWDLVAALDAINALPGACYAPADRPENDRLTDYDASAAREAFFALLTNPPLS